MRRKFTSTGPEPTALPESKRRKVSVSLPQILLVRVAYGPIWTSKYKNLFPLAILPRSI
jgi:hypothetical protein